MDNKFLKFIPADDVYLFNTGKARKAWLCYGCRYIPELKAHRFIVWAPNAQSVSLVGDFNGWRRDANPMEKMDGGIWVTFVDELPYCALYKFCITHKDGSQTLKSDPFAAPLREGGEGPWEMPGYDCPVIMAAGAFIQGASIELSADAPMREPYTVYLQGGLTYESGKMGVLLAVQELLGE